MIVLHNFNPNFYLVFHFFIMSYLNSFCILYFYISDDIMFCGFTSFYCL
jgi:hypothetical protein